MSAARRMVPGDLLTLGTLYQSVGGFFGIDSTGRRFKGSPLGCGAEVRVTTILEGLFDSLHEDDKALLSDWFAEVAIDPDNITATYAEPMRRVA